MAQVVIKDTYKRYGSVQVLHDINIDIEDGEFIVLVGPSGCGKSTLLRMVAGLEPITAGTVEIGDRVVNDLEPKERDIAMVFQSYALYPHMTVEQNMGFALKLAGVSKTETAERVGRAAAILGLDALLQRQPKQLSGGQRQRVAMGRAIVRNPQVFLFDEPLSNLDAKLRVQMRAEIKELHQRLKTTTIYVTHDQVEAMTMADRIVVMKDGVIEQMGAPLDLYDAPETTFVAGFIGSPSMNFIKGRATPDGFLTADGSMLPLPPGRDGVELYGLRPEHITIDAKGVPAQVVVVEPMGSETQVLFRLGEQTIIGLFKDRLDAKAGDILHLLPMLDRVTLFDGNGQRVR
jgi:multiple sugar transport system ATP-binding protein